MICVDLVAPFTTRTPAKTHSLHALTMMDPAINTGWFEIVEATNRSATSIQDLFHNTWLARYPRPQFTVFDNENRGKFKRDFKQICIQDNYGIKKPNQLQVTTHKQMQSLNKYKKLSMICSDHLTLKIIMKIQKRKKIIHLITSFNQLYG
jgi:hypothetical protein